MTDARDRLPDISLSGQIDVVEQRLLQRRQASAAHAAAFRAHLIDRLTSPLALVVAIGVGFAFERWSFFRRKDKPADAARSPDSANGFSLGGMLHLLTLSVSLAEWAQSTLVRPRGAESGPEHAPSGPAEATDPAAPN